MPKKLGARDGSYCLDSSIRQQHSLLGWNICDLNFTTGALFGYSSVNSRVSLKVPGAVGMTCGGG